MKKAASPVPAKIAISCSLLKAQKSQKIISYYTNLTRSWSIVKLKVISDELDAVQNVPRMLQLALEKAQEGSKIAKTEHKSKRTEG